MYSLCNSCSNGVSTTLFWSRWTCFSVNWVSASMLSIKQRDTLNRTRRADSGWRERSSEAIYFPNVKNSSSGLLWRCSFNIFTAFFFLHTFSDNGCKCCRSWIWWTLTFWWSEASIICRLNVGFIIYWLEKQKIKIKTKNRNTMFETVLGVCSSSALPRKLIAL